MPTLQTKWFSITWGRVEPDTKVFRDDTIFCDAGRRVQGRTRVRITDCHGNPYYIESPEGTWNRKSGNLILPEGRNVPYGELLGCFLALKVALREKKMYVACDHTGVTDTWSRGILTTFLRRKANKHARSLAAKTGILRQRFEAAGGAVIHIRGYSNPADLRWL